ncbi:MAG: hypothetical protein ACHQ17_07990 [Polyangia bacterium]|jgi:hypothetical protein
MHLFPMAAMGEDARKELMRQTGNLNGLWIVRATAETGDERAASPLIARVQDELYALAFTNAPRAGDCCRALGAEGRPFYVCAANLERVLAELKALGARGFIVDYDAQLAKFSSAHSLPEPGAGAALPR